MANEAQQLGVYFEGQPVGMVAVDDAGLFTFEYAQAWKSNRNAFAISRSLPLEGGDAQANAGQAFFANLLPEGRVRELVARRLGVSQGNDFALLDALGGECAGALVISRAPPTPKAHSYRPLDEHEIAALAGRGRAFAETSGTDGIRLSLAGAQDKLAVKVDGSRLLLPEGDSPSTHILKFANPDYKHLPENELFVTRLAGQCDIPTVSAELHAIERIQNPREQTHANRQLRAAWRDDPRSAFNDTRHPEHANYVEAMQRLYTAEAELGPQPEDE